MRRADLSSAITNPLEWPWFLCDGEKVRYTFTRERMDADCPDCRADRCVQMLMTAADWGFEVIAEHGYTEKDFD